MILSPNSWSAPSGEPNKTGHPLIHWGLFQPAAPGASIPNSGVYPRMCIHFRTSYVYMCACMYVYMCIIMCIYTYIYIYVYACLHIYIYTISILVFCIHVHTSHFGASVEGL